MNARLLKRRIGLLMCSPLLAALATPAIAAPIGFNVSYVTTSGQFCDDGSCTAFSLFPFRETFSLDSSQLATDGPYDVTSSFSQGVPTPGWITDLFAVDAAVSGGKVVDLVIHFSAHFQGIDGIHPGESSETRSFNAMGGTWSTGDALQELTYTNYETQTYAGTYFIEQPEEPVTANPEPGTWMLILAGGLLILPARATLKI